MKKMNNQLTIGKLCVAVLILISVAGCSIIGSLFGEKKPDLYNYYKNQDTTLEGKVGIYVTGLIMPEKLDNDPDFFYQASKKVKNVVSPAAYKKLSADTGVVLFDTTRFHELKAFEPTELVDHTGSSIDVDGTRYIEKYHQGKVVWVNGKPPRGYGYFLLNERKGGWPDRVQKATNHARLWYYGHGLIQEGLPHESGVTRVVEGSIRKVKEKYGDIPYKFNSAESPELMKKDMFDLLDSGVETVVLVSTQVIFSNYEAFQSSFMHAFEYAEEWEKKNNRKVKIIIAPPIGHQPSMRMAYTEMIKDRLQKLPESAKIKILLSSHGMNWKSNPNEPYLKEEPVYTAPLKKEIKKIVDALGFNNTYIEQAQDRYADDSVDPDQEYLSTNEGYWKAVKENYDYVVSVPITFYAESSDTLFGHAVGNFEGLPTYDLYERIDYPDWNKPLVRKFKVENTTIIYNGLPVGKYATHIEDAYFSSMDKILLPLKL